METVTQDDIVNAIAVLSPGYRQLENKNAIQIIRLGFDEDIISADLSRKVTNSLLRAMMNDERWKNDIFNIIRNETGPNCREDVVIAITETLIAVPQASDLIDYWQAIPLTSDFLDREDQHPSVLKTLYNNLNNPDGKTVWCIAQSIRNSLSVSKYSRVSDNIYQLILMMLEQDSEYACTEASEMLLEISRNNYDFNMPTDDLDCVWERTKSVMLTPEWGLHAHVNDFTANSMKLLGCLIAKNNELRLLLPNPLIGLPAEVSTRIANLVTTEYEEERYRRLADHHKPDSLETAHFRKLIKKDSSRLYRLILEA